MQSKFAAAAPARTAVLMVSLPLDDWRDASMDFSWESFRSKEICDDSVWVACMEVLLVVAVVEVPNEVESPHGVRDGGFFTACGAISGQEPLQPARGGLAVPARGAAVAHPSAQRVCVPIPLGAEVPLAPCPM